MPFFQVLSAIWQSLFKCFRWVFITFALDRKIKTQVCMRGYRFAESLKNRNCSPGQTLSKTSVWLASNRPFLRFWPHHVPVQRISGHLLKSSHLIVVAYPREGSMTSGLLRLHDNRGLHVLEEVNPFHQIHLFLVGGIHGFCYRANKRNNMRCPFLWCDEPGGLLISNVKIFQQNWRSTQRDFDPKRSAKYLEYHTTRN